MIDRISCEIDAVIASAIAAPGGALTRDA